MRTIPEPRIHRVRYFGAYSSKARARRNAEGLQLQPSSSDNTTQKTEAFLETTGRSLQAVG